VTPRSQLPERAYSLTRSGRQRYPLLPDPVPCVSGQNTHKTRPTTQLLSDILPRTRDPSDISVQAAANRHIILVGQGRAFFLNSSLYFLQTGDWHCGALLAAGQPDTKPRGDCVHSCRLEPNLEPVQRSASSLGTDPHICDKCSS